ncbi:MAG: hypothetical protein JWP12_2992 [Bacteroidetes bacterium]|nr:hypothetical protein [Bacteroidota bacterium]
MKKILLLLFVFSAALGLAQPKMNFDLARKVKTTGSSTLLIDVFVKGNIEIIKQLTETAHGKFGYASGNIAVVHVPAGSLSLFVASKSVLRIEAYPPRNKPMNDTMLINNNVIPVHNGAAPLTQAYDGSGVAIGFIDTGIDFTHPDFQDNTGHSRVKFLWDQTQPTAANTPAVYGYGQEWNNLQIDSGLAAAHNDLAYSGHGTHVAGIAAGNGLATGTYKGVAPKADLIFVALDFNSSSPTLITDAVDYIYSKAQLLGEPCVINASLGDYYGSHDGLDLQAQMISSMIDAQTGRAFVSAAGNGGTTPFHVGYTVTADTNFTFFQNSSQVYIPLYADTSAFNNVQFAIGADQLSPTHSFRGRTAFSSITPHLGVLGNDTIYNGSNRIATMITYGDMVNGVYSMEFLITPDSTNYAFRLITTGSGKFDCWTFDVYGNPLPSSAEMPDSMYYKQSDISQTIVGSYNCLDNVISVGNYTNQQAYLDYNNNLYINTATTEGQLHVTSSRGPTRDGRVKPDISAPGDMTVAAVVLSLVPAIVSGFPDALAQGGFHIRDGGTSHSAPGVAGIAALYLQKNPAATATELKNDILCSASQDSFTGSGLPDNNWGYGKANAFGALQGCVHAGVNTQDAKPFSMTVFPNPAYSGNMLNIRPDGLQANQKAELKIYNAVGQLVKTVTINSNTVQLSINLESGIYFCNLISNGNKISSEKLVILQD